MQRLAANWCTKSILFWCWWRRSSGRSTLEVHYRSESGRSLPPCAESFCYAWQAWSGRQLICVKLPNYPSSCTTRSAQNLGKRMTRCYGRTCHAGRCITLDQHCTRTVQEEFHLHSSTIFAPSPDGVPQLCGFIPS